MRRFVGASLLVFVVLAASAFELQAQKEKMADKPAAIDSAKLSGEFYGTAKNTPGSDRTFIVTVETKRLGPNGKPTTVPRNNRNAKRIPNIQNQRNNDAR